MADKVETTTKLLNPFDIIVNPDRRARTTIPNDNDVADLAYKIYTETQLQSIRVRPYNEDRYDAIFGFTRIEACKMIRQGFDYTIVSNDGEDKTIHIQNPDFLIRCEVFDVDDKEAFIQAVIENIGRNEVNEIDAANNQEKLRSEYAYTNQEIANMYGWKLPKVYQVQKLLQLDDDTQQHVANSKLPYTTAVQLIDVPLLRRKEILAFAWSPRLDKFIGQRILERLREEPANSKVDASQFDVDESGITADNNLDGIPIELLANKDEEEEKTVPETTPGEPEKPKHVISRTVTNVRNFFNGIIEESKNEDESKRPHQSVVELANNMVLWLKGHRTDKFIYSRLQALADATGTTTAKRTTTKVKGKKKDTVLVSAPVEAVPN